MIRTLIGIAFAVFVLPSNAQVPVDVRGRLGSNDVIKAAPWVYASSSGPMRGTRESTEDYLATRAMRAIAHSLCNVERSPSVRLEAEVRGFTMVATESSGRDVIVIMRAPLQRPSCHMTPVAPKETSAKMAIAESPARTSEPIKEEESIVLVAPGYSRSKDITIRVFGGEY